MGITNTQLAEDYEQLAHLLKQSDIIGSRLSDAKMTVFRIDKFNEQHGLCEGDEFYFGVDSWQEGEVAVLERERRKVEDEIERLNYSLGIWRHGDFVNMATKRCACPKCADKVAG